VLGSQERADLVGEPIEIRFRVVEEADRAAGEDPGNVGTLRVAPTVTPIGLKTRMTVMTISA